MPSVLTTIGQAAPAIVMLAVFAMLIGAAVQFRRNRRKALLMLALAVVMLGNVLIWTL